MSKLVYSGIGNYYIHTTTGDYACFGSGGSSATTASKAAPRVTSNHLLERPEEESRSAPMVQSELGAAAYSAAAAAASTAAVAYSWVGSSTPYALASNRVDLSKTEPMSSTIRSMNPALDTHLCAWE